MKKTLKQIPVEWLARGRYQPRVNFNQQSLSELAQSIQSQGLIEPIVVRELENNHYEIIAGERRWRAAMMAGFAEIPCLIVDYSDKQAAAVTLIENIQRQDLNIIEEAMGYRQLLDTFHFHQDEIAALVGKSRSHIANILRLLTLCDEVQERLRSERLSFGHARLLVGFTAKEQIDLAKQIELKDWTVRQLEKKIKEINNRQANRLNSEPDRDIQHLEIKLAEQLGTPVQIHSEKGQGGWLQIKFYDNDTLSGVLERIGIRYD